ncbi:MAG: dTDP-glucose 4,6-dehydratase [Rhodospirillaceae bacterium]|nr:dTDP-glucose 4,6-dehydratase [Rhodospirillaceae bacterium]
MRLLVTGGYGFIGSAYIRHVLKTPGVEVLNIDKMTYAANPKAVEAAGAAPGYRFVQADITDRTAMRAQIAAFKPDAVVNFAAETHVDRSIDGPSLFVHTNVMGTAILLEEAAAYWKALDDAGKARFRFHHISTDEVFGTLGSDGLFTETTPYQPNSPYSASKAAADHLVRAWNHTYGLPVLVTNCSNNYGPWQFPEKLIPVMIIKALLGEALPVYGKGENVRDWLHVDDHAEALWLVLRKGVVGESYNVGGNSERKNLDVVHTICDLVDQAAGPKSRRNLVTYVTDRPGHDFRYAIDASKIARELGWKPRHTFEQGLAATVRWYLDNRPWWQEIRDKAYSQQRLGLSK